MSSTFPIPSVSTFPKALYIIFEEPYDTRYIGEKSNLDVLWDFNEEKYQEEIEKKVFNPIDFIKIKKGNIKDELIEMGIEYITYDNLMEKLTPKVYFYKGKNKWAVIDLQYRIEYNRENAYYCFNNSVNIILKRQRYKNKAKWWREEGEIKEITGLQANVYNKASKKSRIEYVLKNTLKYYLLIMFKVTGLDSDSNFYFLTGNDSTKEFSDLDVNGYLSEDDLNDELVEIFNS
jgi:hypothetical protein